MASTSARALTLLSVLGVGGVLGSAALARRLDVSERTLRRDVETLRGLGYRIETVKGTGGGYRLGSGTRLPALVVDEDQAVAIAVSLQTAPTVLSGLAESAARALQVVRQGMPQRLRIEADAFTVTSIANYWEFPAEPIDAAVVREVGAAVHRRHVLRADYTAPDGQISRLRVEPHEIVVWAARWYLVAFDLDTNVWRAIRLDRLVAKSPTFVPFAERMLPARSAAEFLVRSHDRGDTVAPWPCQGAVVLDAPAAAVAEFAPGGAVVEYVSASRCRLRMGAWSWTGLAGQYITFAAGMSEIEPAELRDAFARVRLLLDHDASRPGEDPAGEHPTGETSLEKTSLE